MNKEQIRTFEPPVDDREETSTSEEEFWEAFNSLVEDGLIVPTGELRRGSDGELHPVYVVDVYAKHYTMASTIAEKKKRSIS